MIIIQGLIYAKKSYKSGGRSQIIGIAMEPGYTNYITAYTYVCDVI